MKLNALHETIRQYFQGERSEMYWILGACFIVLVAAYWVHATCKNTFSRTFGITALLIVIVFASTAIGLLFRDPRHEAALHAALKGNQPERAIAGEIQRMQLVIEKYAYYRYASIALAAAGLIAALVFRNGVTAGLACGFCLLLLAQTLVDHYSEARARAYVGELQRVSSNPEYSK